jgi:hypothetical protein
LKGSSEAAIEGRIAKGGTVICRQFGARGDRRGDGMALEHVSAVEYLECVLLLGEKETSRVAVNIDPQEVMELA